MERRKFARKLVASGIKLFNLERDMVCEVNVNNISPGGILVVSYDSEDFNKFNPKEKIRFKMDIPTGEVAGIAEVVWTNSDKSHMGIKFTVIENEGGASNLMAFMTD